MARQLGDQGEESSGPSDFLPTTSARVKVRAREIGGTHICFLLEFDSSRTLLEVVVRKIFFGGLLFRFFF